MNGCHLTLSSIELDTSIQCRADIDISTVNEYAEAMQAGAEFPPVDVFGDEDRCWIGDGWHRVMAAKSAGLTEIAATVRPGGRIEALRFALSANATHGRPRTPSDRKSTIANALREWPDATDAEIADMCAVTHQYVNKLRPSLQPNYCNSCTSVRIRRDGQRVTVRHKKPPVPRSDKNGKTYLPAEQRAKQIETLAAEGYHPQQIGQEIGVSEEHVRNMAHVHNIALPAQAAVGKSPGLRIDPARVIRTTVEDVDALVCGLSVLTDEAISSIPTDQAHSWAESLRKNLTMLRRLVKQLEGSSGE